MGHCKRFCWGWKLTGWIQFCQETMPIRGFPCRAGRWPGLQLIEKMDCIQTRDFFSSYTSINSAVILCGWIPAHSFAYACSNLGHVAYFCLIRRVQNLTSMTDFPIPQGLCHLTSINLASVFPISPTHGGICFVIFHPLHVNKACYLL